MASIDDHLPVLEMITVSTNAKRIFEIGVNNGNSTRAFLKALEITDGELESVDIAPLFDHMKAVKNPRWKFTQINSLEYITTLHPLDILFIDSEHSYDQLSRELNRFSKYVKKGGWIILHDINDHANAEMLPAYKEFLNHNSCVEFYFSNAQGLGVLLKL